MKTKSSTNNNTQTYEIPTQPLPLAYPSMDIFSERINYILCYRFYFALYGNIPCTIHIYDLDTNKAEKAWIEQHFADVKAKYFRKDYVRKDNKFEYDDVFFVLKNDIIIDFDYSNRGIILMFPSAQEAAAQAMADEFKTFMRKEKKAARQIYLIVQGDYGLNLRALDNKIPKMLVTENYNDDLTALHPLVLEKLRKKSENGLFLFYGAPGTGKSTYIRYLVGKVNNKKVIFLSPRIAGNLDSPSFTELLLDNPESVIVIEDAESLLVSRDENRTSDLSVLLNLTDGILGTNLGIQFICTFNTQITNIDAALLRKGRLTAAYEFKPLATEKANVLLEKIGVKDRKVSEPTTLADIYNIEEQEFGFASKARSVIGFR
ncbi:ATPase family associated with various cellular activities (AAA) [Flexibacter flexilis DSM 6793]|uniref:ATPase family associated with various cellular activities (AAA) n=1 Tax=Flexibacter flexilis DSM 6793 TaxID=927664 RepID=A0A1I1FBV6_9BACT|nr:AAA family ATPase [Flexibacter flexilis]SFB95178.1 ATPase family associated with various cellular activities (AAA) [Flexibacter flexilis DSM 6793]